MTLPILCYHKVGPVEEEGRWLNVEQSTLERHVAYFRRRGFNFVLPRDLAGDWPVRAVCMTFDDAYASTLALAPEVLQRHDARSAFYAVVRAIGGVSEWDGDRSSRLASWDALEQADAQGFEIGSHSMTHRRMAELSAEEQLIELSSSKAAFLERGINASSVCYPYGSWNASTIRAASECGYKVGLGLGKRPADPARDHLLALPRIAVAYSDRIPKLLYKIHVRPRLP